MATRDSMEHLVSEANQKLEDARSELDAAKKLGYKAGDDYTQAQIGLEGLEKDIDKMMHSANHQQKEELHRLHLQVSQCLNDMVLDHEDLNQYE